MSNEIFPLDLPVLVQDEIFIYPFMAVPLFLDDEESINAVEAALERHDLIFICPLDASKERAKNGVFESEFDDEHDDLESINADSNPTDFTKNKTTDALKKAIRRINEESNLAPEQMLGYTEVGVIAKIIRRVALPNGKVKILIQGLMRGKILEIRQLSPLIARVGEFFYTPIDPNKVSAFLDVLKERARNLANVAPMFAPDMLRSIEEGEDVNKIIDLLASVMKLKKDIAYELFCQNSLEARFTQALELIAQYIDRQKLQKEINTRVHSKMDKANREYFLREQLRQIQSELGVDTSRNEEIERYKSQLEAIKEHISEDGFKEVSKQIERLARMHPDSSEASLIQSYIEWMLDIPFGKVAKSELSIQKVANQLNADHYSLEKPKERIIEYFAVRELIDKREAELAALESRGKKGRRKKADAAESDSTDSKNADSKNTDGADKNAPKLAESTKKSSTILCFYGPPGVGKTSLANSIATAIGRPLVRIALGGLEDVNELRGHRRTYLGAMPGRLIQGLIEAKNMNPLVVLDEIDKVGTHYRGDPTSALLEILDPEQNHAFRDHYANFNVDLSQCIFIATANDIGNIPAPLRDRMEFIEVSSYTPQEKFLIAKRYLVPQERERHGLKEGEVNIEDAALKEIIESYTREAGVRNLRRKIAGIMRKCAKQILESKSAKGADSKISKTSKNSKGADSKEVAIKITTKNLKEFMDKIVFELNDAQNQDAVGVVNGLAWTSVGGDVLKIEAVKIRGKGALNLTGNLGDVMKESAYIAHSLVKVLFDEGTLKPAQKLPKIKGANGEKISIYNAYDLHLHVPEGATPKDGPSAGIALVCAIASILSNRKIKGSVAMTGEITLRGMVLPIGGLKEKLIAAHKAGIKTAIIPAKNYERDLDDIPEIVRQEMEIRPASDINEVLKIALI